MFCCDAYRIPALPEPPSAAVPMQSGARVPTKVPKARPRVRHSNVVNIVFVLLTLVVLVWYRLNLVVPHR